MGRKRDTRVFRPVTFRMLLEHYELIEALADLKGLDVSAVLNMLIAGSADSMRQMVIVHKRHLAALKAELKEGKHG